MDSTERAEVRKALDSLKPFLAAFLSQRQVAVEHGRRGVGSSDPDMQALLKACIANWDNSLGGILPRVARTYVHELIDFRNRWAHEESFTKAEASRAIDTARLLGELIGMPRLAPAGLRPRSEITRIPRLKATGEVRHTSQRDVMRRIFQAVSRDPERAIAEYAAAEVRGETLRKSDTYSISSEQYARALLNDGLKKGWLK